MQSKRLLSKSKPERLGAERIAKNTFNTTNIDEIKYLCKSPETFVNQNNAILIRFIEDTIQYHPCDENGFYSPIPPSEIKSLSELLAYELSPVEFFIILEADKAYCAVHNSNRSHYIMKDHEFREAEMKKNRK